jgi:NADH-quinone oxidoreductase subunit M
VSALLPLLLAVPLVGVAVTVLPVSDRAAARAGLLVSVATAAAALAVLVSFDYSAAGRPQLSVDAAWIPDLGIRFHLGVDGVSLPLVALTTLLVPLCFVYTLRNPPAAGRLRALSALLLLLEVGMLGTFVALDLVLFFVAFEVVLLPMYFLIGIWGGTHRAAASAKFLLYTLLGSGLMFVGFLVVRGGAGTFDMVALAHRHGAGLTPSRQLLAFALLLVGFGVKSPMWPLHTWLPDAHTEAPTVGSVLLAGVLLKMGTYGFVRIAVPDLPGAARQVAPYLGALAVVGIVYAALCCLAQRELKRLIAYSSVGHMGFVLLGIATLTPTGLNAALVGNVAHGLITGLLFFLVGSVKERYGTLSIDELGGLRATTPVLGGLLAFASIASLGLPGLAGFWGELLAMLGSWQPAAGLSRPLFLAYLALAAVGSALTTAYFLRLLQRVTVGRVPPAFRAAALADVGAVELAAWAPLVALVVAVGLYPRLVLGLTDAAVRGLLR